MFDLKSPVVLALLAVVLNTFISSGMPLPPSDDIRKLAVIDSMLTEQPQKALSSLSSIDPKGLNRRGEAYFYLLQTIARHKNHLGFENDSAIQAARKWFEKNKRYPREIARAQFYNGVVRYSISASDTVAYHLVRASLEQIDRFHIQDDRLSALANAYLGKMNDFYINNLEEAARYYSKAIEIENRIGNTSNLIINQSNLLTCLVKMGRVTEADSILASLDSCLAEHPDIQFQSTINAKMIYYQYAKNYPDSALSYCLRWDPSPADIGAKENMLASIYRQKGLLDSAVMYEKASLAHRRPVDTMSYHIYYRHLADDYKNLGVADSSAHYARLAYEDLHKQQDRRTEKRVLELEKQYDLAAKEAELVRERNRWQLLLTMLIALLAITGLLFWQWRLLRQNVDLQERQDMKDTVAMSIIHAVVSTYAGINKRLTVIHNLPDGERQDALNRLIQDNKTNVAKNLSAAIEDNYDTLPKYVRRTIALLDGAQQKAVFILTEIGFSPGEIGKMLGISSNQVRTVKTAVRDRISTSPDALKRDIVRLQIMQMGRRVHNSKNGRL